MTIPQQVQRVLQSLENAGFEAWCVGGCVRDLLLGRTPQDWDVTTSALPEQVMAVFGDCAIPTGLQHGTVTVVTELWHVEVTTYRTDGAYLDHRHPQGVSFVTSIHEDLARRDFTINAMALNLAGTFQDPFDGQGDLQRKCLRCVGVSDVRFTEDALRMLRGLRFASQLDFTVDPATALSIHSNRHLLSHIAVERIWVEMGKLLRGVNPVAILREYVDVVGVFWEELLPMEGFSQRNPHHCYDLWEHSIRTVETVEDSLVLRTSALLHDVGKVKTFTVDEGGIGHFYGHPDVGYPMAEQMLRRLKVDTITREQVVMLVKWHDRGILPTEKAVKKALRKLGVEQFTNLLKLKRADNLAQHPDYHGRQQELDVLEEILAKVLEEKQCFSLQHMAVNGHDLMDLGYKGQAIGLCLKGLLDAVIDQDVPNEQDDLTALAKEWAETE
ncbi:HD domain-containing protein [Bengtsoniella intestinalis]|uniref:CCA tRNA nucleotidyltransferase n=1 Tax=Bengtsoniella intestinalis TaxID=3073143 RepID=UPI00391F6E9A